MPLKTLDRLNPEKSLLILDFFEVDYMLPKHAAKADGAGSTKLVNFTTSGNSIIVEAQSKKKAPKTWVNRWFWWIKPKTPAKPVETEVAVQEVFSTIKVSQSELKSWDERDKALNTMIDQARSAGQYDMLKKLEATKGIRSFENILYAKGRRKYMTEEQLLAFTEKCEKGLCLDWIKNFIRPIPEDVVAAKVQCDKDHLFDNYAILHFDPKNRATTEEARAKARDPILFGLIQGSRKLYFVGDWQDELCDLTFQQIVDKLGNPLEIPSDPKDHAHNDD